MRFEDLTPQDIDYARKIYKAHRSELSWDEKMKILMNLFGKSERTTRKWCSEKLGFAEKVEQVSEQYELAKQKVFDSSKNIFFFTWAQNNTPVHKGLLREMEAYANFLDADIHIIAGRYKNPTSLESSKKRKFEESWSPEIRKYLDANRHNIHRYLSIMSDVKIQPTAVNPMSGMEGMSRENSCIFGSPKVQMNMIPVLFGQKPKMIMTTGAITKKNYTDSKSGKKGEFHHTFGFVIVEIKDDETFFTRQVTAKSDGSFCDLFYKVKDGKVSAINSSAAIVLGDYHAGDHDEKVIKKTLDLLNKIKPKNVVLHDVFDGKSINHHEMDDPFIQYQKEVEGKNSLKDEVDLMLNELERFKKYKVVIVRSNHDDFVDRWLKKTDWRKASTPKNSLEYMNYSAAILRGDAKNGVIPWIIKQRFPEFVTLNRTDSYIVNHWELANHGDLGTNGSRGNVDQYRKFNTKVVIGHSHSPARKDNVLQVGTSTKLRLNYNVGPSSWLNSHVIIHENSKAQHIHFIEGEYTTIKYIK
jgi:hypothetical protein